MKLWSPVFILLLLLLRAEADDGFVRTSGQQLILNGSPFYANGFNAYWLMYFASDPSQRSKVSSAFQDAVSHGLSIGRTWAFSDGGYSPLQYSPGQYNDKMFQVKKKFSHSFEFLLSVFWVLPLLLNGKCFC